MIGILIQLAISWGLLWLYGRNDLRVLGLRPTRQRMQECVLLFAFAVICCSLGFLLKFAVGHLCWRLNPSLSIPMAVNVLWWHLKSVLFEELLFRGALLYILIRRFKWRAGVLLSAIAFGMYHWFSYGLFGNPVGMLLSFVVTAAAGLVYACGYARSRSILIPTALHLGWNLTQGFLFPDGPIQGTILVAVGIGKFRTGNLGIYALVSLLPLTLFVWGGMLILKRLHAVGRFPIASRSDAAHFD